MVLELINKGLLENLECRFRIWKLELIIEPFEDKKIVKIVSLGTVFPNVSRTCINF